MSMNECVAATTPEDDYMVDVKNAVYTWVLVNHPEVIEDARQMMQPQEPGEEGYHARPAANGGMGSGGYLMNHLTGKSEWVEDIGDYA